MSYTKKFNTTEKIFGAAIFREKMPLRDGYLSFIIYIQLCQISFYWIKLKKNLAKNLFTFEMDVTSD